MRSVAAGRPGVLTAGELEERLVSMGFTTAIAVRITEITAEFSTDTEVWPGHGLIHVKSVPGGFTLREGQ